MRYVTFLCFWLFSINSFAQAGVESGSVEMADALRADGKIYVVVVVAAVVVLGLLYYLTRLDRRIGRMERELDDERPASRDEYTR
ncbi:MAG: CcmD family protein [Catalinimonas sp.]